MGKLEEKFITESKNIVTSTLVEYFEATDVEIIQFTKLIEHTNDDDWTCGFGDELLPLFEEMRTTNSKEKIKVNTVYDLVYTDKLDVVYKTNIRYCGYSKRYYDDGAYDVYYYFVNVDDDDGTVIEISEGQMDLLTPIMLYGGTFV